MRIRLSSGAKGLLKRKKLLSTTCVNSAPVWKAALFPAALCRYIMTNCGDGTLTSQVLRPDSLNMRQNSPRYSEMSMRTPA